MSRTYYVYIRNKKIPHKAIVEIESFSHGRIENRKNYSYFEKQNENCRLPQLKGSIKRRALGIGSNLTSLMNIHNNYFENNPNNRKFSPAKEQLKYIIS